MTLFTFLQTLLGGLADACCVFLVFAACLQLAWHQKGMSPSFRQDKGGQDRQDQQENRARPCHSPCWWKEVCLPLGAAYIFAWHWHGAGEGLVLWLSLLAPCVLAAALMILLDLACQRHVRAVRHLSLVLFVPAVALLVLA